MKTKPTPVSTSTAGSLVQRAEFTERHELAQRAAELGPDAVTASSAARAAVGADLVAAAADRLFRPLCATPTTADALAQHAAAMQLVTSTSHAPQQAAEMHAQALAENPALSALFRTSECVDVIAELASRFATPAHYTESHSEATARVSMAARRRYQVLIAKQLGGPLAEAFLAEVAAEERAAIEAAEREAAAAAEAERKAEEQREAKRRARAELSERVQAAAKAAAEARAVADATAKEHRRLLAESVRAGLEDLSTETIRVNREVYDVRALAAAAAADNISLDRLNAIAAALVA